MEDVYAPQNEPIPVEPSESLFQPLTFTKVSPVHYELESPARGFVVFATSRSNDWTLERHESFPNLGITNAFAASPGQATVRFKAYDVLLILYIVAGSASVALIGYSLWCRLRLRSR